LDLKASQTERKFRKSIQVFLWFLCEYLAMSGQGEYDYKSVSFTFRYNIMANDKENSEIARDSKGIISDATILQNHPWVNDSEAEQEQIEKERGDLYTIDDVVDDDE